MPPSLSVEKWALLSLQLCSHASGLGLAESSPWVKLNPNNLNGAVGKVVFRLNLKHTSLALINTTFDSITSTKLLNMRGHVSRASRNSDNNGTSKSGRHWTASQIQRKRELDRESQRVARQRTKSRISYLEALVKSLRNNDNDQVKKLHEKIDEQQAEIQKLRDVIRSINRLCEGSNTSTITAESTSLQDISSPVEIHRDLDMQLNNVPEESTQAAGVLSIAVIPMDESIVLEDIVSPCFRESEQSQTVTQLAASIADDHHLDGRLWYLAGGVLRYILQNNDSAKPLVFCNDEDIAIRAVFEGWPAVIERYDLDSGWQWIKELDERIYFHLSAHNRLMHMRNTRLVFGNQVSPNALLENQIPPFFRSRPSQAFIRHDTLVEHFPWPGFRERLLFSPLKYATNRFMDTLRTHVDFTWNLTACELYTKDPSGLYHYSDVLVQRMTDIRCYAAKREFFIEFPELRADIPCSAVPLHSLFAHTPESFSGCRVEAMIDDREEDEDL